MPRLESLAALEAAVQAAENQRRRGNLAAAFDRYRSILSQRLSASRLTGIQAGLIQADVIIIDRVTELAILFGYDQAADSLLAGLVMLFEQAGNRYAADYTTLRRIEFALQRGLLRDAYQFLQGMRPTIGDVLAIRFSPAGLEHWESERHWPRTSRADRPVLFSRLYLVMGWLLAALGQYRNALAALERGLAHSGPAAPDLAQQANLKQRLVLAGAQLEKGDLAAAQASLADLERVLDERVHPGYSVRWLELSGKLNLLRGELGGAIEQFIRILEICHQRGFHQAALRATLNLSHVLIFLNQTSVALEYLLSARSRASVLNDAVSMLRANYLLGLAQARGHSLADAVPIAPSISEMWRGVQDRPSSREEIVYPNPLDIPQSDNYLAYFEDRALAFHWLLGRHDLQEASAYLTHMKQVFGRSDSALIDVRLRVLESMLAYYTGQLSQAEAALQEAQRVLRGLGLRPELWQVQRILGWCWARLGRSQEERHTLLQEAEALLRDITGSLSSADQTIFLLNKWTTDEEYMVGEINQLAQMKRQVAASFWLLRPWWRWAMMKHLDALLQHIDRYKDTRVKQAVGRREDVVGRSSARPLWRRLLTHPRDRITLSFLVLPDRVLVIQAGWLSLDFGVSPITRIQMRDLVRRWHEIVSRLNNRRRSKTPDEKAATNSQQTLEELEDVSSGSRALYLLGEYEPTEKSLEVIIEESKAESKRIAERLAKGLQIPAMLDALPERIRALTICPDDSLHGFPFAAIVHRNKYLIESYALSVVYDSSGQRSPTMPSDQRYALAVGVSQGLGRFSPLPGTLRELDQIEPWLTRHAANNGKLSVIRLVNKTADKATVLGRLPQAALLHIACHGTFEHNRPDQSGLVLVPSSDHVEILSLRDLSRLDLSGLHHITLSSCWSADHFILPGRWVISLPETLWRAGAHSILGSLWEVDDRLAIAFMTRFYNYLDDLPRDEALRQIQLDCLRGQLPDCEGIDTANPIYWAGYNLYGDHKWLDL